MWLFIAFPALLAFAAADLLGKKKVSEGGNSTPLEMLLNVEILAFAISLFLAASGLGESGLAPWELLRKHPLLLLNLCFFLLYWLFYLWSLRYIGLALEAAVSGANGIFYFFGLAVLHAVSGKLTAVDDIFAPARLIPVLLVLIFTTLFPNIELLARKSSGMMQERTKRERRRTVAGLLILLAGMTFDAGDTLITTWIFSEENIGIADYLTASYFATLLPIILCSLFLRKRNGKWFIPFKDGGKYSFCYACTAAASSLLYLYASSLDAVRTGILFIAAPVFPIIGARFLLKEKYTWRQNLCIGIITAAVIAFCAAEYL